MLGSSPVHQDPEDPQLQLHLHKRLSAHMMDAEHATNVNPQQTVHTLMLKSSVPKAFQSKSMRSANF
jgi:hypothetical protein